MNEFLISNCSLDEIFRDKLAQCRNKGLDNISAEIFSKSKEWYYSIIKSKTGNYSYKFTPYLQLLISKGKDKLPRVLSIPTIRDGLVLLTLKKYLNNMFPNSVHNRHTNYYIRKIKEIISNGEYEEFTKIDIVKFFPSINHNTLLDILEMKMINRKALNLIRKAIKTPTITKGQRKPHAINGEGIPQGLCISNILANIYLEHLDDTMNKHHDAIYFRYVDDILMFHKKAAQVSKQVKKELERVHLNSHPEAKNSEKAQTGKISDSIYYLGYIFKDRQVSIRESSIDRYIKRIISRFCVFRKSDLNKKPSDELRKAQFVSMINEMISGALYNGVRYGWIFYYLEITDLRVLYMLDGIVRQQFYKIKEFNFNVPPNLKSYKKAYYQARFNTYGGYIHDYSSYDNTDKKVKFINDNDIKLPSNPTDSDIQDLFDKVINWRLSFLQKDDRTISGSDSG